MFFCKTNGVWVQEAKLVASDAAPLDNFGFSVGLSGNTAIIGSPGWAGDGEYTGAAYIFVRNGTEWTQELELTAQAAETGFGRAVALQGSTAIVGTLFLNNAPGVAYVFEGAGSELTQQAILTPSDSVSGDAFGEQVAISGNTALIGSGGFGHA